LEEVDVGAREKGSRQGFFCKELQSEFRQGGPQRAEGRLKKETSKPGCRNQKRPPDWQLIGSFVSGRMRNFFFPGFKGLDNLGGKVPSKPQREKKKKNKGEKKQGKKGVPKIPRKGGNGRAKGSEKKS